MLIFAKFCFFFFFVFILLIAVFFGNYQNLKKFTTVSVVLPELNTMTSEMSAGKKGVPANNKTQTNVNGNADRTLEGKQKKMFRNCCLM